MTYINCIILGGMGDVWNKGYAGPEEKPGVFDGAELQSGEYITSFSDNNIFSWNDLSLITDVATESSRFRVCYIILIILH